MKIIKLLGLALIVTTFSGCASRNISPETSNFVLSNASVDETITILDNRARSNESLCVRNTAILECELLGLNANDPRQFMKFVLIDKPTGSKMFITRWTETKLKNGKFDIDELDVTQDLLNAIGRYIENHRNKLVR